MWTQMSSVRLYTDIILHIQDQKSKSNKKLFRIQTRPLLVIGKEYCVQLGQTPAQVKCHSWTGFPSALLFLMQFEHSLSAPAQFSGLYIVSLVVILIGFVAFNAVPTPTAATDSSPSSSPAATCEEGCSENPVDAQELQPTEDRRKRSTSGPEQSYGSTELGTRMWSAGLQSPNMSYMYF